jgi:hypothetical protein
MKRLVVSSYALLLSVSVGFAMPTTLAPPPCPSGETFQFCEERCPASLQSYCIDAISAPPQCNVIDAWCQSFRDEGLDCYGNVVDPWEWPPGTVRNAAIWCTYQGT